MEGRKQARAKVSAEGLESRPDVWPAAWKTRQLTTASQEKCLQRNLKSADGSSDQKKKFGSQYHLHLQIINRYRADRYFMTAALCCSVSVCFTDTRHIASLLTVFPPLFCFSMFTGVAPVKMQNTCSQARLFCHTVPDGILIQQLKNSVKPLFLPCLLLFVIQTSLM